MILIKSKAAPAERKALNSFYLNRTGYRVLSIPRISRFIGLFISFFLYPFCSARPQSLFWTRRSTLFQAPRQACFPKQLLRELCLRLCRICRFRILFRHGKQSLPRPDRFHPYRTFLCPFCTTQGIRRLPLQRRRSIRRSILSRFHQAARLLPRLLYREYPF